MILYPIGDAGQLTALKGNHKPPFGFAAVFPDRNGKGNLKSYRMNDIALEKDNDVLSIGFRPEDTTSEQMLNCIRNLIDIGIIAKDDASS